MDGGRSTHGRESVFARAPKAKEPESKWIPAFAGMTKEWIPAFAGMTKEWIPAFAGMTRG